MFTLPTDSSEISNTKLSVTWVSAIGRRGQIQRRPSPVDLMKCVVRVETAQRSIDLHAAFDEGVIWPAEAWIK
jgi:hypothetical protein